MTVELKDLVGLHRLSGVDSTSANVRAKYGEYFEDCDALSFVLDGLGYTVIEDPEDGYRSSMREIRKSDAGSVKNRFKSIRVMARLSGEDDGLLEFIDVKTGKDVLTIGTDYSDSYYPQFIRSFVPENMCLNVVKVEVVR